MSCTKKPYSKLDAMIALSQAEMRRNLKRHKNRQERRFYFCGTCDAYHLTSMTELQYLETKGGVNVLPIHD